jgi:hypothetical protein
MFLTFDNNCFTCLCDVTLSVYPHRAGLKNMPGHGGIYTESNITQVSYSHEYITPTQRIVLHVLHNWHVCNLIYVALL